VPAVVIAGEVDVPASDAPAAIEPVFRQLDTHVPTVERLFEWLNGAYRPGMTVESALQTPDGEWRVEIVRRGRAHWYRILRGEKVIDWLGIGGVERILGEAGVDMAELVEVKGDPPPPARHGAA
jgi:hypothetical protein